MIAQSQKATAAITRAEGLSLYGQRSLVLGRELGRAMNSAQLRRHALGAQVGPHRRPIPQLRADIVAQAGSRVSSVHNRR